MSDLEEFLRENQSLLVAESVEQCLNLVLSNGRMGGSFRYYRGMANSKHGLLTSLDRTVDDKTGLQRRWREQFLLEQFIKVAHNHLAAASQPQSVFQWLAMMQHYGVPTRLLDITRSPFVALYFAVRDWSSDDDAALWSFNPTSFHERALHVLSSLGFPHVVSRHSIFHLRQFVADPFFREAFLTDRYPIVVILEPEWTDLRAFNQQGAFMIQGSLADTIDGSIATSLRDDSYMDRQKAEMLRQQALDWSVVKLVIPHRLKQRLAGELRRMNVHAGSLFPGLDGLARSIAELSNNELLTDRTWHVRLDEE